MSAFFSKADVKDQRFRLSPNVRFRPEAVVVCLRVEVKVISQSRGFLAPWIVVSAREKSEFRLLRHLQCVVDVDPEIANRAFELRVSE